MGMSFFQYWGKSTRDFPPPRPQYPGWHLLVWHCLDVAVAAFAWWETSKSIRRRFAAAFGIDEHDEAAMRRLKGWVLFFVALHDFGKFDVRFQRKAWAVTSVLWPELAKSSHNTPEINWKDYDHGLEGFRWFRQEVRELLGVDDDSYDDTLDAWEPWMAAVAGHHGEISEISDNRRPLISGFGGLEREDAKARHAWFLTLEALFLAPVGLSLKGCPLQCGKAAQHLLAGFCSVADWIGSNTSYFPFDAEPRELVEYFNRRLEKTKNRRVLEALGLVGKTLDYARIQNLLPKGKVPRGVQTLVDDLAVEPGLLLVEAPTGSGKTEAALAHAWRLLAAGHAESIVFALPTQATANAMLKRLEDFAGKAFQGGANVVLAHGKSQFNDEFKRLAEVGRYRTTQGEEEASVQCSGWLSQSRKRAFLGQIGVCTVDQTLLSVLPVRHQFVRGFGLNRSVLIVDEVHAYDSYMTGLLEEVLRRQEQTGGSAILLSATLPANQRRVLLGAWCAGDNEVSGDYPLLTHVHAKQIDMPKLDDGHCPELRTVAVGCRATAKAEPDDQTFAQVVQAAEKGARVVLILNLVDAAQRAARRLREMTEMPVDIFHARYRFKDRQEKENAALAQYGKDAIRETGRILVATQVVEQSLDLDFDWMVTQICPVDLLFQRLGRLHRHERKRPPGFESPRCLVLTPDNGDYGLIETIYGDARVLWRTEQLLRRNQEGIVFPEAYRQWIEAVYGDGSWEDEPDDIIGKHCAYRDMQKHRRMKAQGLVDMTISQFRDDDDTVASLTRDGEMSFTVLPLLLDEKLLDGERLSELEAYARAEAVNLNGVPAPASWKFLKSLDADKDYGPLVLPMTLDSDGWRGQVGNTTLRYTKEFGLEKSDESTD
jgi:CRISPR-associated endonuclease/helicase Cas3